MSFNLTWDGGGETKKKYLRRAAFDLAALFLIALIVMTPLGSALAQSSTASATPSSVIPSIGTTSAPSSGTQPTTPSIPSSGAAPSTALPAPTSVALPPPAAPTPASPPPPSGPTSPENFATQPIAYSSFGQDRFTVDKNTGALRNTYSITLPPGRNGLQPNLDLVYNSQDTRFGSIFGEGWSVNIPYIERLNKSGADNLYSTSTPNYFTSSLDGELVSTSTVTSTGATYVARTESGSFNRYSFSRSSNQWTMTDKNGAQYAFGSTSDSRQSDPNNASDTYQWMLKQVTDTNGNTITYAYFNDSGQIYPSSTLYTGNGSSTGIFEVDFLRASSNDNATSSLTAFGVKSNYRISEVDTKVNGTWARKYVLAYTTGDNASTTLLGSITESGENSSGTVVTLPTSTFSYQTQSPGWTTSSTWNPPIAFLDAVNNNDNGVIIADVNGDGLPDIIRGFSGDTTSSYSAWINTGHGWAASSTWNPPVAFWNTGTHADNGARVADVNGDGLPDIIRGDSNIATTTYSAWINTGHGWAASSTWNPPVPFVNEATGYDNGVRVVDVNGDGLPDIIQGSSGSPGTYVAWINNGNGWATSTVWAPPIPFINPATGYDNGVRVVDVNGDGLPDIIQGSSGSPGTYVAWINNGNGWTNDNTWAPPIPFINPTTGLNDGVQIADVNGDSLPDIIQGDSSSATTTYAAYINNGHGWTSSSSWNPPVSFLNEPSANDNGNRVADVNGDGLPDILRSSSNSTSSYAAWVNNNGNRADLLTNITYATGGSSVITYKSATQYTDGSGNPLNQEPYPVYVVSQVNSNDGTQNVASTTYQYSGGTYYYGGPTDKQFAGFNKVTETDAAGNVTKTYYHTGNGTDSAHGEYVDNYWKIGKPYRVENYDNGSNLYKKTINKWDSVSLGGNAAFVKLASSTESDYDGLSTHKDSAESYTYDNTNGNETQKIQWGQVTANDDGTFTDTGTDDFTTNTTYATSTTGVIGKPSDVTVTDHNSNKVKETQYYYDNLVLGSASLGNLTKELDWKSGSGYATSQNTYNSYGLVTLHLDPRNSTTTYAYDTYNLYPATSTNALGQSTGYQYDYASGKTTRTTDPNGNVFQTAYDGLSRPLAMLQPDPNNPGALVTSTAYVYIDTANAVAIHESDYLATSTTVDAYRYYDGLNRLIQTRKSAEDSGNFKVTDRAYNNINVVQKESLPYFASGSAKTSATTTTTLFTNYTYDALKRVLTIGTAVGTTTNSYANWKVATTDPRGKEKDAYDDAYSNLIQVDEHSGTSTYSTYYAYDGLKDLTKITDALGNVRNFTFDGLGRRLTTQDLHPSASTNYGTWNYTYDDAGNLTQQVDPKNQTSTYAYDSLNRATSESFGGQTQIAYTYDTCTQGVGRLCIASSSDAITTSTYNALGQLVGETKAIGTSTYATSYAYDRQGNQLTITNPDNSKVIYSYNLAGLPEAVSYQPNGGSPSTIISNFDYSPTDQPATIAYANGVTVTNTYDPTKLYRLTQKVGALPSGNNAQNISYTYDADGNITQLVDAGTSGAGRTVNYAYDDFSRLINASTTNVSTTPNYNQTFTYDALGNILTGPAGTYTYGGTGYPNPDAPTAISSGSGGSGWAYNLPFTATSSATAIPAALTNFSALIAIASGTVGLETTSTNASGRVQSANGYDIAPFSDSGCTNQLQFEREQYVSSTGELEMWVKQSTLNTSTVDYLCYGNPAQTTDLSSSSAPWDSNYAGVWHLNQSTGTAGTALVDSTTNLLKMVTGASDCCGHNDNAIATSSGSIDGAMYFWAAGQYNGAGASSTVNSGIGTSTNLTFETWLKFQSAETYDVNYNMFFGTGKGYQYENMGLYASSSNAGVALGVYDNSNDRLNISNYVPTSIGQWYHIVATYDGSLEKVYENGVLTATSSVTLGSNHGDAPLYFGYGAGSAGLRSTDVVLDEPRISNTARSASYVAADYWNSFATSTFWTKGVETAVGGAATTSFTYDNNGNLLTTGNATNTWNYRNQLTQSVTANGPSAYAYDYLGNRIKLVEGSSTTLFPTRFYNIMQGGVATTTKHIFADNLLLATVTDASSTSATRYVLDDHLSGINVVTDASGTVVETLDYYPYLQARLDTTMSAYGGEKRKAIGEEYDTLSKLNYLNARYYDSSRGQFISEEPIFLALGDQKQVKQLANQDQQTYLSDPQQLNSYSYGRDNPITKRDPNGKCVEDACVAETALGASFLIGGGVNAAFYAGTSWFTGQKITPGGLFGSFVTGGTATVAAEIFPLAAGASLATKVLSGFAIGSVSGAAGDITKQGVDIATGYQHGLNAGELVGTGLYNGVGGGFVEGVIPPAEIPTLSEGQNSWNGIMQAAGNGTLKTASFGTGIKAAIGAQAADAYKTAAGAALDVAASSYNYNVTPASNSTCRSASHCSSK